MAILTPIEPADLASFLTEYGIKKYTSYHGVERGSVNSNFVVEIDGERVFLRLYEEQTAEGARRETDLVAWLAAQGIATPAPRARLDGSFVGLLAGKPSAVFPFVAGEMSCQRGLSVARMEAVGEVLARIHRLTPPSLWPSRFGVEELRARLDRIAQDPAHGALAGPLRAKLEEAWSRRDPAVPRGLVHGDVFRDNVLWDGDRIAALLDFESASDGPLVYDLAVTALAFGYGDAFVPDLVRGLLAGYQDVRPLVDRERAALFHEARAAALRFTITRITDYAMRAGAAIAQKDYRRFTGRLAALEAMGEAGFRDLTGT